MELLTIKYIHLRAVHYITNKKQRLKSLGLVLSIPIVSRYKVNFDVC